MAGQGWTELLQRKWGRPCQDQYESKSSDNEWMVTKYETIERYPQNLCSGLAQIVIRLQFDYGQHLASLHRPQENK